MVRIDTDHDDAGLLVTACLIAAGILPAPTREDERRAFQRLGDQLGDGLDRLPRRPPTT